MGRPFSGGEGGGDEDPACLRDATVEEDSEGEEREPSGDAEWVFEGLAEDWQDPSDGGVLSQVLRAAEEGDADALTALLQTLSVSVDSLVRMQRGTAARMHHHALLSCFQLPRPAPAFGRPPATFFATIIYFRINI